MLDSDEQEGLTHAIRDCKLYTITDAAKLLGVSRKTVYAYGKRGLIKIISAEGTNPRIFGRDIINYWKGSN